MSNNKETKSQIKLNRKMRLWNKYRIFCIIAAVVLVVIIVASVAVKNINGKKNNELANNNVTTTAAPAQNNEQKTTTAAQQESTTQQTTTQAATGSTLKLAGSASAEQFTKKDFYNGTVFLGDSVISGISSYGYLDNVYGNVNATSAKLEDYVSAAIASNPSKVFIMVGHNDANYGTIKEESLADHIVSIVEAIHKSSSSTKVYVLSMTPITSAYENKQSINVKQSYIDTANKLIEQKAATGNYTYIDVASAYKDDSGYMKTECTGNGINLTTSYYPFLLNGIADLAK